jgi:hypothetical protein
MLPPWCAASCARSHWHSRSLLSRISRPHGGSLDTPARSRPCEVPERYVWIPAGHLTMGCSLGDAECEGSEKHTHEVTLTKGF